MLTKAQAMQLATTTAISQFQTGVAAALEANAIRGIVGVTGYSYPPSATQPQINGWTAQRQGEGWTVAVDQVGFTVTLS